MNTFSESLGLLELSCEIGLDSDHLVLGRRTSQLRSPPTSALDGLGARQTESQEAPVRLNPGEARESVTVLHFTRIVVVKTDN